MNESSKIGNIGETYVAFKLAKLGINCFRTPECFDYDFITDNNKRIEVKTSRLTNSSRLSKKTNSYPKRWAFANTIPQYTYNGKWQRKFIKRDRECDFFVLVCLTDDFEVVQSFIIPKAEIGTKSTIAIYLKQKSPDNIQFTKYKECWDAIKN